MKFVVDRSKWRCGGSRVTTKVGEGATRLLNLEGFMCCLGQCAIQLGKTPYDILNKAMPHQIGKITVLSKRHQNEDFPIDTQLSKRAAEINDDVTITLSEREKKLTRLFKRNHHDLVFVGEVNNDRETFE